MTQLTAQTLRPTGITLEAALVEVENNLEDVQGQGGGGSVATLTLPDVTLNATEDTTFNGNVLDSASTTSGGAIVVSQFSVTSSGTNIYSAGLTSTIPGVGVLTVNANGTVVFDPESNYTGSFTGISVQATDGTDVRNAAVTLTTYAVNDVPEPVDDGDVTNDGTVTIAVLANDRDVDSSTLTVTHLNAEVATVGVPVTITNGTATLNSDSTVTIAPTNGYTGVVTCSYTVSDGQASATATISVLVSSGSSTPEVSVAGDPVTPPLVGLRTWHIGPDVNSYPTGTGVTRGTALSAVNFADLRAGDVINLYYSATPYKEKPVICAIGTAQLPCEFWGVTDEFGRRPIIDGDGAVQIASTAALVSSNVDYGQSLAIMLVKNPQPYDPKPEWVRVANVEFRNAGRSFQYTDLTGATHGYGSGRASGLIMGPSNDCTIENCIFRGCAQGVFTVARNQDPIECSYRTKIRFNRFYDNGTDGGYLDHNAYVQVVSPIVEGNYFGPQRPACLGSSYKSRSSGEIFRYNWVIGSSRAMDWVHGEDTSNSISAQADYGKDIAYGNVVINDFGISGSKAGEPIHYGGDNWGEDDVTGALVVPEEQYRSSLIFFNNTCVLRCSYSQASNPRMFGLSLVDTTVHAWDNVFVFEGTGGAPEFSLVEFVGNMHLHGSNFIQVQGGGVLADARTGADAAVPVRYHVYRHGSTLSGSTNLRSLTTFDYRLAPGCSAIGAASGSLPSTLPSDIAARALNHYPPRNQPVHSLSGLVERTTCNDLGALETGVGSGPPPVIATNSVAPSISGIAQTGQTLTAVTGTWDQDPTSYLYQWQSSVSGSGIGTDIGGATAGTRVAGAEAYVRVGVRAVNPAGTAAVVYSQWYQVSAAGAPAFTTQPSSVSADTGSTATFTVATIGTGITLQAQRSTNGGSSWSNIGGATSTTYTTATLLLSDSGTQFRWVATNVNGSATSTVATLTVAAASEPDGAGVFNFDRTDGALLGAVSSSFTTIGISVYQAEVQSGRLQCTAGTGGNGGQYGYPTGHAATDQHLRARIAHLAAGELILSICCASDGTSGYAARISGSSIEFRRAGVWTNQVSHGVNLATTSAVFGIDRQGSTVTITVNGATVITFPDDAPFTTDREVFSLVPGANVADVTIESLTYTRGATL